MKRFFILVILLLSAFVSSSFAYAAQPLEVSGWIPYWKTASGTAEVSAHLTTFKEVNPFGYTVRADGTLADTAKLSQEPWLSLQKAAQAKKIRYIPTLMWSDGEAIHKILSNDTSRRALAQRIADLVKEKGYDGIDIDFEGKKAETKQYFATFLKGLYMRMGNKWVMCSIEARTPLDSRYEGTPPASATMYANDFVAINSYCDRVRIMAYDQRTFDVKLNKAGTGPYIPVADIAWVEKVINLTAKDIKKSKLVIGIPTYGHEYAVTPLADGKFKYDRKWAFNPQYAYDLMAKYQPTVTRNRAGEMSFTYTPAVEPSTTPAAADPTTVEGAQASVSTGVGTTPAYHIVWWSDAKAVEDKVNLAKKLGVRGVALFKIDGAQDPSIWDVLKKI
jgi:spore germination protein YaaH